MTVRILLGDARKVLESLPEQSVQCVVTSPPYWGGASWKRSNSSGYYRRPR